MGLRYLLVEDEGLKREVLFLVNADEELKILSAIRGAPRKLKLVFSKPLEGAANHRELTRLLSVDRKLGLSAQPVNSSQVSSSILEAHVRGVNIADFETALLELNPSIASSPGEIIRLVAKAGLHQHHGVRTYQRLKLALEPIIAAVLLITLLPLLLLLALLVKLTSHGKVLYSQERLGLNGKEFKIMKFRSMRTDAEANGPVWASAETKDSRLSPIGSFLRATHLDELPQFWNVLRGEISFIGPRPERKCFSDQLQQDLPSFCLRTMVKPGITGWAQTCQGYANCREDSRKKLELDLYYIIKHSPALDAQIVFNTVRMMMSGGTEARKRALTASSAPLAHIGRAAKPAARP